MGAAISSKFVLLLSFLLLACGQTTEIGNKLTDAEIEFLRLRASRRCITDTNADFVDFISASNSTMLDYDRDKQEWDLKYSTNTSAVHKIYIWKSTSTAVYFHIVPDESTTKHIFLKVSRQGNDDLMRQVQADGCAKGIYKSSVNSSAVTMTAEDPTFSTESTTVKYKYTKTWKFGSSEPGFFGLMEYTLKKQFYNNDGDTVSTPAAKTETYTITADTTPIEQSSDLYTSDDYPNKFYCVINDYTTTFIDVLKANATDTTSNLKCITNDAATVAAESESFQPSAELPL